MKKIWLSLLSLPFIVPSSFAGTGKIEESVFISEVSPSIVKLIQGHPELTMDHMSHFGFELYGPKGMKQWLNDAKISFSEDHDHGHAHHNHTKDNEEDAARYPTFEEIETFLKDIVAKNPKIAKLMSIGKSVEGRDLWVVKLSDNVEVDELEPEFKYISSMHGNEITGRELTQFLIKDMIEGYGKDQRITDLINNTEIYIMPSMNPDGSKRRQRANAAGYDLNRNFPDWTRSEVNSVQNRQPETIAVMNFQKSRQFSLSANFHGGAVVVNYPWDSTYERHPLDGLVQELSLKYAGENPDMRSSRSFEGGITNGADWYVLHGGMQDWSYFYHNDLQVTVELSSNKWPRYRNIPGFYKDNKDSMMVYMEAIHQGGGIKLKDSNKNGRVHILKNLNDGTSMDMGSFGFNGGEFYKVLTEGEYTFNVQVEGSSDVSKVEITVDKNIQVDGNYKTVEI